jgi:hypothetical protein
MAISGISRLTAATLILKSRINLDKIKERNGAEPFMICKPFTSLSKKILDKGENNEVILRYKKAAASSMVCSPIASSPVSS